MCEYYWLTANSLSEYYWPEYYWLTATSLTTQPDFEVHFSSQNHE